MEVSDELDSPAALLPGKKPPVGTWDAVEKRKVSCSCRDTNKNFSVFQTIK
jgi:hypothetical protein